jgi:hypothetical protein
MRIAVPTPSTAAIQRLAGTLIATRWRRFRWLVGEEASPAVAVLGAVCKKKPDESIPAPKGRESWPPKRLLLQIRHF